MKKIDYKIPIIIIVTLIVVIGTCCYYFKGNNNNMVNNFPDDFSQDRNYQMNSNDSTDSNKSGNIINTKGEVSSSLTEKKELHATYYMSKCYVENN